MTDTGEIVPDIQFDESGKLAHQSRAAAAIKALPKSETADKLELFERHREQWIYNAHGSGIGAPRRFARLAMWFVSDLLKILYAEIFELAHALQKEQLDKKALAVRVEFYQDYLRLVEAQRGFHAFLFEHYRTRLAAAHAGNRPLLDLAKEIIIDERDARAGRDEHAARVKAISVPLDSRETGATE